MDIHDLTAAYALDALDADEAHAYEAHLEQCERCREELATLTDTATSLAWATESPAPPARLRASILARAAAERENVVPLPVSRTRLFRATAAVAAVAACAAVGVAVWATTLSSSLDHQRSASRTTANAVEILADQSSRRTALPDGRGVVAVDPGGEGVLVLNQLGAAPAGKTYEAWVIPQGATPEPAGLFHGGGETTVVRLGRGVPAGAHVALTVEHAGGVDTPTQTPLFSVAV